MGVVAVEEVAKLKWLSCLFFDTCHLRDTGDITKEDYTANMLHAAISGETVHPESGIRLRGFIHGRDDIFYEDANNSVLSSAIEEISYDWRRKCFVFRTRSGSRYGCRADDFLDPELCKDLVRHLKKAHFRMFRIG